jgi:hypothetical protein
VRGLPTVRETQSFEMISGVLQRWVLVSDFISFANIKTGTERDFTSSFLLLICFSRSSINCCPKKEPENCREIGIDRRKNMQRDFLKN